MERERHPFAPSRRHLGALLASAGALALPAIPAIAATIEPDADPFPGWLQEGNEVIAKVDANQYSSEAEADRLMARWGELDRLGMNARPTTIAGAAACIAWARRDFVQFQMGGSEETDDPGNKLILTMIDHALGVLRSA